ncbi:MAG: hypothetical protein FWF10_03290 [Clostridiales bacterium]|nr:hypothetical protein [Clostridiales bacterium]
MTGNIDAYKAWVPADALWTDWAKPVLFANMPPECYDKIVVPELPWITRLDASTAIIADLPGRAGVLTGLALARLGYRPVPLYNGVCEGGASMVVPNIEIMQVLCGGAKIISAMPLRSDAPPAFLLDANRLNGFGKQPGSYDNRWCVFPQDLPSAAFLRNSGIRNVIVRTNNRHEDLTHILYRYQSEDISIFIHDGIQQKPVQIHKPSRFKHLFYRVGVIMGLRRNAAGGFGAQVPEPGSGGRYYGYG